MLVFSLETPGGSKQTLAVVTEFGSDPQNPDTVFVRSAKTGSLTSSTLVDERLQVGTPTPGLRSVNFDLSTQNPYISDTRTNHKRSRDFHDVYTLQQKVYKAWNDAGAWQSSTSEQSAKFDTVYVTINCLQFLTFQNFHSVVFFFLWPGRHGNDKATHCFLYLVLDLLHCIKGGYTNSLWLGTFYR